jgi:hypothetical protein
MDMSRFLQYIDEKSCDGTGNMDGTGKKKRKRKGKEENIEENYTAGKGGDLQDLVNVLTGWPNDIAKMIGYENYDGALRSLKTFKTKVISDLEKAIKAEMKK